MAVIVEDGTGLADSNSFSTLAGADTYHAEMGNEGWAALAEPKRNAALLYASMWIDNKYSWRGNLISDSQAMGLPTEGGLDDQGREITGLPLRVAHATAELALIHSVDPLTATLGPQVIEEEVSDAVRQKYSDRLENEGVRYPFLDVMLKGLHSGSQSNFLESMGS